jgi:hypothetical protein
MSKEILIKTSATFDLGQKGFEMKEWSNFDLFKE